MNNKKTKMALIAALAGLTAGQVTAQTLTNYTAGGGDVLICFRSQAKVSDLVVDAGPVTALTALSANQTNQITAYTTTQLAEVDGGYNVSWSAFTWTNGSTLFMTRPRTSLNKQSTPWPQYNAFLQNLTINDMTSIPNGASDVFKLSVAYDALSTPAAVVEPDQTYTVDSHGNITAYNADYITGQSYLTTLNPQEDYLAFNFGGDFTGSPENNSGGASGFPMRSDFYEIPTTGNGPVIYLGYFQLNADGTMNYVAYPSDTPVFNKITRAADGTHISYTAGLYGTYTLYGATSLNPPVSWTPVSTLTSGDKAVHTYTDPDTTSSKKFYRIIAQ